MTVFARTRDVKHFLGNGGNMERLPVAFAEEHTRFAQGNQQQGRAQFVEQAFAHPEEVAIPQRIRMACVIGDRREFKSFLPIRCDQ